MRRFLPRAATRGLCIAIVSACIALGAPAAALAQKEGGAGIAAAQAATEPSYVFPYFLIVLSTGLGLYLLAKPSQRKNPAEEHSGPT